MTHRASTRSTPLWTLIRVVLSSPILLLILMLAVSAAAEEPVEVAESVALPIVSPPRAVEPAWPTASTRILGFDVSAMTGSLVDDGIHRQSGFALPWGRGPLHLGDGALGLSWGWRF